MKFSVLSHRPCPSPVDRRTPVRGRIELVVGKGAEAGHFDLFGLDEARQWDLQKEKGRNSPSRSTPSSVHRRR
jgi:hypothetical protein